MRHPVCVFGILVTTAVVGCSTNASDPDTDTAADEVRTAQCPAAFTLALDKPQVYSRTPTKYYDGSTLATGERGRVATAMTQARRFRKQTLSFKVTERARGKCSYVSALSDAPTAPRAVLRGTSAKPIVDVAFGAFRYFAFPKTYSAEGFTFPSNAKAGLFSQVAASGPFGDGASLIVKVGNAKITNAPAPPPNSGGIASAVAELESEAVLAGPGRNDDYAVTGRTPMEMVKSYIAAKYADDPELGEEYTYQENASGFARDEQVAGTLTKEVALAEAVESVRYWYDGYDDQDDHVNARVARVQAALDRLVAAGATFGFDGFEQNACAAPTTFLLVIDTQAKHVYGVDLNPCEE